jgi:hypothetical protein
MMTIYKGSTTTLAHRKIPNPKPNDSKLWCLIHNAHFGKIPSFCKILDPKITHLKLNFDQFFCLLSAIVIQACHSKEKFTTLLHKIVCISQEKIPKTYVRYASELCE